MLNRSLLKSLMSAHCMILLALISGCSSTKLPPSGLTNRAFVINSFGGSAQPLGVVQIINVNNHKPSTSTISAGIEPAMMAVSPDLTVTLVYNLVNEITVITNSSESTTDTISLPDTAQSLIAVNASTGFAAMRNAPAVSPQTELGEVAVLNLTSSVLYTTIGVPRAHYMVMDHSGTKLLVFSDMYSTPCTGGTLTGSAMTVIDIGTQTVTPVCGFDQAAWGVFSSDDTTAYIMNCGPECGGTNASVQPLSMSQFGSVQSSTPVENTFSAVPASAATIGFLNGSTLYVAGSPGGALGFGAGKLDVFDVSSGTPVRSMAGISISDGYHTRMVSATNDKLFVGSIYCTNGPAASPPTGCLTIFDTSTNTAVITPAQLAGTGVTPPGITGMAAISNQNLVYVVENSRLQLYDTSTSALSTNEEILLAGQMVDVQLVD
ncbi:MAG: hypothetical protein ABSD20_17090, partial [Terriglobales bacterium]